MSVYLFLLKIRQDDIYLLMKHVLSDFYKHKINKVSGGSGK